MNKYIKQLIADSYAAQNHEEFELKAESKTLDIHNDVNIFISLEEEAFNEAFGKVCGLKSEQFPPANLLTDEQMEGICEAIDRLLFSWNLYTDLPDELPVTLAYKLLVGIFDQKNIIVSRGHTDIEFCNITACPFGEFCECKKIDEAMANREKKLGSAVLNIISTIKSAPQKLPDPTVFELLYPETIFCEKPVGPILSIRDWLGFADDLFPPPDELTDEQTEAISCTLLKFMNENVSDWVSNISPKLRYISLVSYLDVKAKYNGKDGLILVFENS